MPGTLLSVREIRESDIDFILRYWFESGNTFLQGMGVDLDKMPRKEEYRNMLRHQIGQPYEEKKSYCIIWEINNKPAGHSNISKIIPGEEASMHLHLWESAVRKKGLGTSLVKMSLPWFFKNYKLKTIYSEPYALNPAPNKTLEKAGFTFVKKYTTTPGWINFEQEVNRWEITHPEFKNRMKLQG